MGLQGGLKILSHAINSYYVCYSTKYIGGHSDLVAGAVSYATEEQASIIHEHQILLGTNLVSCTVYRARGGASCLLSHM